MNEIAISATGLVKTFRTRKGDHCGGKPVVAGGAGRNLRPDRPGWRRENHHQRVILGLLTRTAGESSILGFDSMRDTYAIRERVGYIAQQFVLPADLTVMENMRFFASMQGMSQEDQNRRIPELLEFAGLTEFTGRLAGKLSGGMKKKLALACSLIHEPQVVMLDEPTLGVDPVSRREFWNLLGNLRAEKGLTIFVCTPYMDEAERCTRVGLIYTGRLIASDTPAGIKAMVPGQLLELTPSNSCRPQPGVSGMAGRAGSADLRRQAAHLRGRRAPAQAADRGGAGCAGIHRDGLREIEVRMEEAFISLVQRQSQVEATAQARCRATSRRQR